MRTSEFATSDNSAANESTFINFAQTQSGGNPMINLDEIRARCEAATPGPWTNVVLGNTVKSIQIISHSICKKICSGISPKSKDYEFIQHARTDIPALLSLLSERDKEIARLTSVELRIGEIVETFKKIDAEAKRMLEIDSELKAEIARLSTENATMRDQIAETEAFHRALWGSALDSPPHRTY